jgi:hypothetical protein
MPWRLAGLMQSRLETMKTCRFDAIMTWGHGDLQVWCNDGLRPWRVEGLMQSGLEDMEVCS